MTTARLPLTEPLVNRCIAHPEDCLLIPLGSELALFHYVRTVLDRSVSVRLMLPDRVKQRLNEQRQDYSRHTGTVAFEKNRLLRSQPLCNGKEVLVINAGHLPDINMTAAWRCHRRSGAPVTLFFDSPHAGYCQERLATDGTGSVYGAYRDYSDSLSNLQRSAAPQEKIPIAVGISRSASHALARLDFPTFDALVHYLATEGKSLVGRVQWLRTPAARLLREPLDRLLRLIEHRGAAFAPDTSSASRSIFMDPTARLSGSVLIGRDVHIAANTVIIGPTAIGHGARIEQGAVLARCVVLPGTVVPAGRCHYRGIFNGRGGQPEYQPHRYAIDTPPGQGPDHGPITIQRTPLAKRCLDLLGAAVALVILSPVLAIVALAVKFTSPGPALYRHRRQGLGGVEFDCLKFRTMIMDADRLQEQLRKQNEVDGPQFKISHDPRITPIGNFLRRTNLDELPQVVNVLKGQMSLVGPRPSPDKENQYCPVWRKNRLAVPPGITGLWQVTRSPDRKVDFQEWIHYDLQYIKHQSMWLDLQILWQTLRTVLGPGASHQWRKRWRPTQTHNGRPATTRTARSQADTVTEAT